MLEQIRKQIINILWQKFIQSIPNCEIIFASFEPILDHLAIIDINSADSGIQTLQTIFQKLGFTQRGKGYIPEKVNDFIWMAEKEATIKNASAVLPQVVLADFRNELLSRKSQSILRQYTANSESFNFKLLDEFIKEHENGSLNAADNIVKLVAGYLSSKPSYSLSYEEYNWLNNEN